MRNSEAYLGSLVWVAVATLLPIAALEPVKLRPAPEPGVQAASPCDRHVSEGGCADAGL
jgi:hypothetical protein